MFGPFLALWMQRLGIRRNDAVIFESGRKTASSLFHCGNHIRYKKIDAMYSYILAASPKPVFELLNNHISFAIDNYNGDALDFRLEEINKKMKRTKTGDINDKFWMMNSRTLETTTTLTENLRSGLGMQVAPETESCANKNLAEMVHATRLLFRQQDFLMKEEGVEDKLRQTLIDGEKNRKKFICDIISEVGRKNSVTEDVLSEQSTEVERDILVFNNDAVLTYLFISLLFQQKFSMAIYKV